MIRYVGFDARKKQREALIKGVGSAVCDFFWEDALAKHGYEDREGQQDMSFEIMEAIKSENHVAIEAGVGIGKSFAYLVPLLIYNNKTGKPVVIATSTITLQEQLYKDAEALKVLLNINTDVILAKGQTHYLCQQRADDFFENNRSTTVEQIKSGIAAGCQDRRTFSFDIPNSVWDNINIVRFSKHKCILCNYWSICQYFLTRDKLISTDGVILYNQDLLTIHLMKLRDSLDGLISGEVEIMVIDEAHNLESKVRSSTTVRYGKGAIISIINAAQKAIFADNRSLIDRQKSEAVKVVVHLYRNLEKQMLSQIDRSKHDMKYAERFFFRDEDNALDLLKKAAKSLDALSDSIQLWDSMSVERVRHERNPQAVGDMVTLAREFAELCSSFDDKLVWIERTSRSMELVFCPKNTKKIISQLYFEQAAKTILTSATLTNSAHGSVENQYSYFVQNTGFPVNKGGTLSEPKPSPFPYDEHAMIYYCDDLPHPTNEREVFIEKGVERLVQILDISSGRALVLFTAKTDMEVVFDALKSRHLPYKILMQQSGSSQERTLKEFRENTDSVLLGSGAYWEGISIEGKTLSNLVIFRLPFPVPDPIIEYKTSLSKDAFMEVSVPEMVMMLKQGVGRLIRNFTDKGLVSIVDSRLRDSLAMRYRDIVWDALPIRNRTNDITVAKQFYDQLYHQSSVEK